MSEASPSVIVLAGPNGAGKSTAAPMLLNQELSVDEFVNADVIAAGLSAFEPERVAFAAGRILRTRIHELARRRARFAFETTLAARSFAPWLASLKETGYTVQVIFLWIPSAEIAVSRVAQRVRTGGHSVPEEAIRRRYSQGLRNFFGLYQPLATTWHFCDNSRSGSPALIAVGSGAQVDHILDVDLWRAIRTTASHE